ncbi:CPBP family intramembrane glutamic endopeptidase [Pseudobutyrivibrio xylanivorans]|uniref:CPBP family intramembrane metalloprotease n=1 Tax=Pseudobutyrivibrio xylanivorans TaxID=185007 RepID=A0A5P6VT22_PSEXY|nr:type II CAAX endopeptidase family protein [Pseudobutyrivibrio xylanivorans]QFJ54879.1 CPBP family intramembrane metalloprotease [Pseudobutyrivibrio xylanivorans]
METRTVDKVELIKLIIVFAIEIIVELAVSFALPKLGNTSVLVSTLVLDALLILVTLIYTFKKGDKLEAYGFKKIKVSTFFFTVLLTFVSAPMYMFANVLSQLFVPNILVQNMDSIFGDSMGLPLLAIVVVAPICEEIVMRGFFHNRLKNVMPFGAAAVLSGFMFGALHLNLNQFCYAWVLGVLFAYANRASGSTITSVIMHMLTNGFNMAIMIAANYALKIIGTDLATASEAARTNGTSAWVNVVVYGILAVISFFLSRKIIRAIAKRENN